MLSIGDEGFKYLLTKDTNKIQELRLCMTSVNIDGNKISSFGMYHIQQAKWDNLQCLSLGIGDFIKVEISLEMQVVSTYLELMPNKSKSSH